MESRDKKQLMATAPSQVLEEPPRLIVLFIQRYFYYFVILEIFIILCLGYWFLLGPKINAIFKSEPKQTDLRQEAQNRLISYEQKIKELQTIKESYANLSTQNKEKIEAILPAKSEERELMTQLNQIISANGLLLKSMSLGENKEGNRQVRGSGQTQNDSGSQVGGQAATKVNKVTINFEVRGVTYSALKSLLAGLENNPLLVDVQSVKYTPKEEEAALELAAYYYPVK